MGGLVEAGCTRNIFPVLLKALVVPGRGIYRSNREGRSNATSAQATERGIMNDRSSMKGYLSLTFEIGHCNGLEKKHDFFLPRAGLSSEPLSSCHQNRWYITWTRAGAERNIQRQEKRSSKKNFCSILH